MGRTAVIIFMAYLLSEDYCCLEVLSKRYAAGALLERARIPGVD
jgi:hypothetical protein